MLDKSIREIERERQGLQTQEKKLIAEIKKTAKQGQMVCFTFLYVVYLVKNLLRYVEVGIEYDLLGIFLTGSCESDGKGSY